MSKAPRGAQHSKPWVEVYRPRLLSQVAGHPDAVSFLQQCLNKQRGKRQQQSQAEAGPNQHFLLTGPPGVGKTTCARCYANQLVGVVGASTSNCVSKDSKDFVSKDSVSLESVLFVNASVVRTQVAIRDHVEVFIKRAPGLCCVVLDEIDSMTSTGQQAIRYLIKQHGHKAVFVCTCNTLKKIGASLQSCFFLVKFNLLTAQQVTDAVLRVARLEQVSISQDAAKAIANTARGDLRAALTALQTIAAASVGQEDQESTKQADDAKLLKQQQQPQQSQQNNKVVITKHTVYTISDIPLKAKLDSILLDVLSSKDNKSLARSALQTIAALHDAGHAIEDMVHFLQSTLDRHANTNTGASRELQTKLTPNITCRILESLATASRSPTLLQMQACLARIASSV